MIINVGVSCWCFRWKLSHPIPWHQRCVLHLDVHTQCVAECEHHQTICCFEDTHSGSARRPRHVIPLRTSKITFAPASFKAVANCSEDHTGTASNVSGKRFHLVTITQPSVSPTISVLSGFVCWPISLLPLANPHCSSGKDKTNHFKIHLQLESVLRNGQMVTVLTYHELSYLVAVAVKQMQWRQHRGGVRTNCLKRGGVGGRSTMCMCVCVCVYVHVHVHVHVYVYVYVYVSVCVYVYVYVYIR